jgi:hypothetical protein
MNPKPPVHKPSTGAHTPHPVDLSNESVAGEEDPGAGVNVPASGATDPSASDAAGSGNSLGSGETAGGREGVPRRKRLSLKKPSSPKPR